MHKSDPNVILVVFDTARADAFDAATAPTYDSINTNSGTPSMYSTAGWTLPSHLSMFTGAHGRELGLQHALPDGYGAVADLLAHHRDRFLAQVFRHNGYRTRGISHNPMVSEGNGMATGFEHFDSLRIPRTNGIAPSGPRDRIDWLIEAAAARVDDGAAETERLMTEWIDTCSDEPFFWFVNLMECHSPYLPPSPYTTASMWDRVRSAREASRWLTFDSMTASSIGRFDPNVDRVTDDALRRIRRGYRDSVRQLDAWLQRLMDRLDAAGKLDETILIVTSDHGENLGELGMLGHNYSLDDRLIRVPFATHGPVTLFDDSAAHSLVELPFALGSALGLDHPWQDPSVNGLPVAQFDTSPEYDEAWAQRLQSDWGVDSGSLKALGQSIACATDATYKLYRRNGTDTIVDLRADSLEADELPVDADLAPKVSHLVEALDRADHNTVASIPTRHGSTPSTVDSEDLEDRLRLLGYL